MKNDSFNRMSRAEYFAQSSTLTAQEAQEHRELLQGVDLASAESLEDAAAQRAVREIKRCADQEVKAYLNSDDFKQMVENIKRRERERLLQDIMLEVSKERYHAPPTPSIWLIFSRTRLNSLTMWQGYNVGGREGEIEEVHCRPADIG